MATASVMSPMDTPQIPVSQAVMSVQSTTRIAAPASAVFRALRNIETWRDWNRWVPRVNITYQPPEEDLATVAEIEQLVRNTSIAGSIDSDLTDGAVGGSIAPRYSQEGEQLDLPPTNLQRMRLNSNASKISSVSGSEHAPSEASPRTSNVVNGNRATATNGLSAAQRYQASQEARRASVASGETPTAAHNTLASAPAQGPISIVQAPSANPSPRTQSVSSGSGRKSSIVSAVARAKSNTLAHLYGEPSVRLQPNTKMTFYVRMNATNPRDLKTTHIIVTEVSRPDDVITEGAHLTQLTRSKTHTLSRSGVYRVVWQMNNDESSLSNIKSGSAFPKSMLVAERVHEIRPIILGDGSEECEYRTWENQKGPVAKMVKKKYHGYIQAMFEVWGKGLGEFCEAQVGKVDRRDFSISIVPEDVPTNGGLFTFS